MMLLPLENPDEIGFPPDQTLDKPNMRDISNSLKTRYFAHFWKAFFNVKIYRHIDWTQDQDIHVLWGLFSR